MWITLWKLGISFANIVVIKRKKGFSTFSQSDRKRVKKLGWSTAETGDLWTKKDAYPQLKACVYPRSGYPQRGFPQQANSHPSALFRAGPAAPSPPSLRPIREPAPLSHGRDTPDFFLGTPLQKLAVFCFCMRAFPKRNPAYPFHVKEG